MRILLAEDERSLAEDICNTFTQRGHTMDWLTDGLSTQRVLLSSEYFDAVILNLDLPKRSGLEILNTIRKNQINTPVLVLSTRKTKDDLIIALNTGADDYLQKPFALDALYARLHALVRRNKHAGESILSYNNGALTLDPIHYLITVAGQPQLLPRREFAILKRLLFNKGKVTSRDQLIQAVYGWQDQIDSNTIEVHMHNLRKKIGHVVPIRTVRGVGYMIEIDNPSTQQPK